MKDVLSLGSPVESLKGVGEAVAQKFSALGITTIGDLLLNVPRRYDDFSKVVAISAMKPGVVTIKASIVSSSNRYARRGMHITEAIASDETGSVRLIWFNQSYRAQSLKKGVAYYISGEFGLRARRLSIVNPSIELVSDFPVNTARIVPIYRETKGLKSSQIRRIVKNALFAIDLLEETLPEWIIQKYGFPPYGQAIRAMHFPENMQFFKEARHRLAFEEVFQLSLAALMNKYELLQENSVVITFDKIIAQQFVAQLPFKLTDAQRRTVWRIYQDMERSQPMNRLIEGDVGSGKTVIAVMAALMAIHRGFQVALMAPTELLARQHADTVNMLLSWFGLTENIGLLVGSLKSPVKRQLHQDIASGKIKFIIGTHAVIQEKVNLHNLGLVIVDEQHRFGVEQRKALQAKAGVMPHVLSLTATPIPRSLALTLYGEMDISILDTKPTGRVPIQTQIFPFGSRNGVYKKIAEQLLLGRQAFVVCPLIQNNSGLSVASAEETYIAIKKHFNKFSVGLLHGKMTAVEKDAIMQRFVAGDIAILVSTTVIEVGVNVPNASVMLIESADRFGLAQIHQLRGRVGRSSHQGYCFLMLSDNSSPSQRLRALETSQDGFALAELDLQIRGPGAIYGTAQHGALDLKIASLTDVKLIAEARAAAQEFIDRSENLLQYTVLSNIVKKLRSVTNLN